MTHRHLVVMQSINWEKFDSTLWGLNPFSVLCRYFTLSVMFRFVAILHLKELKWVLCQTFFFFPSVIAVDIFDKSNFTGARIPRFHEIKEDYPKDLESSVIFPDTLFRPSDRKGKILLLTFGWQLQPAPKDAWLILVALGWERGDRLHKRTLFRAGAAVHTSEAFCLLAARGARGAAWLAVLVCRVPLAAPRTAVSRQEKCAASVPTKTFPRGHLLWSLQRWWEVGDPQLGAELRCHSLKANKKVLSRAGGQGAHCGVHGVPAVPLKYLEMVERKPQHLGQGTRESNSAVIIQICGWISLE